jgi:hypothetical protein
MASNRRRSSDSGSGTERSFRPQTVRPLGRTLPQVERTHRFDGFGNRAVVRAGRMESPSTPYSGASGRQSLACCRTSTSPACEQAVKARAAASSSSAIFAPGRRNWKSARQNRGYRRRQTVPAIEATWSDARQRHLDLGAANAADALGGLSARSRTLEPAAMARTNSRPDREETSATPKAAATPHDAPIRKCVGL